MNTPLTRQQAFDAAATHLLKQGRRSEDPARVDCDGKPWCLYRGPEGLRCSVGAIIPDDLYEESMDEDTVAAPYLDRYAGVAALFQELDWDFLSDLQGIHDNHPADGWRDSLQEFADRYDLRADVLRQHQ